MHPLARLAVAALPLAAQVLATSQINFDASPLRNTTKTLDTSDALFLSQSIRVCRTLHSPDVVSPVLAFAQILAQLEATFYQEATAKFNDTDFESAGYVPKVPLQIIASILEHSNNHATQYVGCPAHAPETKLAFSSVSLPLPIRPTTMFRRLAGSLSRPASST